MKTNFVSDKKTKNFTYDVKMVMPHIEEILNKSVNRLEPFKRVTIQLILLNPTKIRTNSKIQKILNEKKNVKKCVNLNYLCTSHINL